MNKSIDVPDSKTDAPQTSTPEEKGLACVSDDGAVRHRPNSCPTKRSELRNNNSSPERNYSKKMKNVPIKQEDEGRDTICGYTIEQLHGARRPRWRVYGYRPDGRRVRNQKFKRRSQAVAFREKLVLQDDNSEIRMVSKQTELSIEQLQDAEEAYRRLRELPPPDWKGDAKWTLCRAVRFVSEKFKPTRNPKLLSEGIAEFLDVKQAANLRPKTIRELRSTLRNLDKACPGLYIHEVTAVHLRPLSLRGTKKLGWQHRLRNFSAFFKWAKHPQRGYCPENPAEEVFLPDVQDDPSVPKSFDNERALRLFQIAQTFENGCLFLYVLLGTVMALRPTEIGRMEAARQCFGEDAARILGQESITFSNRSEECLVHVLGKCRKRRTIEIIPQWIDLIRVYVQSGFPFVPSDFRKNWDALRRLVGFKIGESSQELNLDVELVDYDSDMMRHTGLTNHLGLHGKEGETALFGGNSPDVIHSNYKGQATRKRAEVFYALAKKLKLPTIHQLEKGGVPEGATATELRQLGTPIEHHTTYFLSKEKFQAALAARKAKLGFDPLAQKLRKYGANRTCRIKWPPDEDLAELIKFFPETKLAEALNCSAPMIHLRAKARNIPLPGRGYWTKIYQGPKPVIPQHVQRIFDKMKSAVEPNKT